MPRRKTDAKKDPLLELVKAAPVRQRAATMSLSARFIELDEALFSKGVPRATQWWRERVCRWLERYEKDGVLELWGAVGRGASKSTVLYKLCILFTRWGDFQVPAGEVHYAVVLSRLKEEASKGVQYIARWLTLLGVAYERKGDVLELSGLQRGIRVVAASVQAASGWRTFFIACDEFAKWQAGGVDTFDADEVRSSAQAMSATHRNAPILTFSSPWAAFGSFYEHITTGSTDAVDVVGPAPTWVAAAEYVTEADVRRKEPNSRRFDREYACKFSSASTSVFLLEYIDRAIRLHRELAVDSEGEPVLVIDASRGGDMWARCIARYVWAGGKLRIRFSDVGGVPDATNSGEAVKWLAKLAKDAGAKSVLADQFDAGGLRSMFLDEGISFFEQTWSNKTKIQAVDRAERLLRDEVLLLPDHPDMRAQLLSYKEKLTKSGDTTYEGRRDDLVAIILTAILGSMDNKLPVAQEPVSKRVMTAREAAEDFEKRWIQRQESGFQKKKEFERDWNHNPSLDDIMDGF